MADAVVTNAWKRRICRPIVTLMLGVIGLVCIRSSPFM